MLIRICIFISVIFSSYEAVADEFCLELVRHAVYDEYAGRTNASNYSETKNEICQAYEKYASDNQHGQAQGTYDLFGGGLSFSKDQVEAVGEAMCDQHYALNDFRQSQNIFQRTLNSGAIDVLKQCAEADQDGVKFNVTYPQDLMSVEIYFVSVGGPATRTFTSKPFIPDTLDCTGPLANVQAGDTLTNSVQAMTCSRKHVAPQAFQDQSHGGRLVLHEGGTVIVYTSGKTVSASMPILPAPVPIPPPLPANCAKQNAAGECVRCEFDIQASGQTGNGNTWVERTCSGMPSNQEVTVRIKDIKMAVTDHGAGSACWVGYQVTGDDENHPVLNEEQPNIPVHDPNIRDHDCDGWKFGATEKKLPNLPANGVGRAKIRISHCQWSQSNHCKLQGNLVLFTSEGQ